MCPPGMRSHCTSRHKPCDMKDPPVEEADGDNKANGAHNLTREKHQRTKRGSRT